jgi:hypothetical protein
MARRKRRRLRKIAAYKKVTRKPAKLRKSLGLRKKYAKKLMSELTTQKWRNRTDKWKRRYDMLRIAKLRAKLLKQPKKSKQYQMQKRVLTSPESFDQGFKSKKRVRPLTDKEKRKICRKRLTRREVLFAKRKTGKGGQRKPIRRNPDVICRRK